MDRFISLEGPDQKPSSGVDDIRFLGSFPSDGEEKARKRKAELDRELAVLGDSSALPAITALVFRSSIRKVASSPQRFVPSYLFLLADQGVLPPQQQIVPDYLQELEDVGFDLFTVPTHLLSDRNALVAQVNNILTNFSQQNPPGSVG
jgi:hypothetical protein